MTDRNLMEISQQDRDALVASIVRLESLQTRVETLTMKIDSSTVSKLELELQIKLIDDRLTSIENTIKWFTKTIIGLGVSLFLLVLKTLFSSFSVKVVGLWALI